MSWVGKVLGNQVLDKEIAQGGMATVYRAYQAQLERWVAIKVIEIKDEQLLQDFRQEAKVIATLQHPNILPVYDYGEQENIAYIVMEYVSGGTLAPVIREGPLRWSDAAALILPTGEALAHAHEQGILHCDVKPSNILLPRADWPLLTDFGLFQIRKQQAEQDPDITIGTPAYASPEQVAGVELDQRTDIYSLGIVLYQLLTNNLPFRGNSEEDLMWQRLTKPPLRPSFYNHQIDSKLEQIILRALAKEPDKRYSTMTDFISDLAALPDSKSGGRHLPRPITGQLGNTRGLSTSPTAVTGPHLLVAGTDTPIPLPDSSQTLILGRRGPQGDRQPDIDLTPYGGLEAGVSRLHARLQQLEGDWFLTDLSSTNGTSLNMRPLKPAEPHHLTGGDIIRCGRLSLVFYQETL